MQYYKYIYNCMNENMFVKYFSRNNREETFNIK